MWQEVQYYLLCCFTLGKARWPPSKLVRLVNMQKHTRGCSHTDCNVVMSMSSLRAKSTEHLFPTPTHLILSRCEAPRQAESGLLQTHKQVHNMRYLNDKDRKRDRDRQAETNRREKQRSDEEIKSKPDIVKRKRVRDLEWRERRRGSCYLIEGICPSLEQQFTKAILQRPISGDLLAD